VASDFTSLGRSVIADRYKGTSDGRDENRREAKFGSDKFLRYFVGARPHIVLGFVNLVTTIQLCSHLVHP
jgi:hypothetical protein